ncbi:hypothetical protein TNCT_623871 [Trichonephila clavata]|uniref:Uncharacterized protein n=1 Tax=Trichonephila clavata TaxID=2740835 RepID=A0A8X6H9J5_TRICU|nr:hypothetical protein TNCT_623871 [Trichonephila clavata]
MGRRKIHIITDESDLEFVLSSDEELNIVHQNSNRRFITDFDDDLGFSNYIHNTKIRGIWTAVYKPLVHKDN